MSERNAWRSQLDSFVSGGFGGICLVLVGQPFDLVKVKVQTEDTSVLRVVKDILRTHGVRGFYRGVSAPLIGITPIFAICFWGYDLGAQIWNRFSPHTGLDRAMFSGAFSALPTTLVMAPSERIKIVMQTAKAKLSLPAAFSSVWASGGFRSLFRGSVATLARDVPGSVAYFGVYEALKDASKDRDRQNTQLGILAAGGMAGVSNWLVAIPADVVKSRWQSSAPGQHTGAIDVLIKLLRNEGPSALFKGMGPVMLRAFPANAACFFGMESSKSLLQKI